MQKAPVSGAFFVLAVGSLASWPDKPGDDVGETDNCRVYSFFAGPVAMGRSSLPPQSAHEPS